MQARFYDPIASRFLSADPIGYQDQLNLYAYVHNDPVNAVDPTGMYGVGALPLAVVEVPPLAPAVAVGVVVAGMVTQPASPADILAGSPCGCPYIGESIFTSDNQSGNTLPEGLVGENPQDSRGKRKNSGPLTPENGGTGSAEGDFEVLTGGNSQPAAPDRGAPEGTLVGDNDIALRPSADGKGPRIDIPANGDKPPETLHYPE